jgi:hypothetical protein
MSENRTNREPIPEEFGSIAEAGAFWDTHSLADYWDLTREVEFEVDLGESVQLVAVERNLLEQLAERARQQGLSTQTLVNLYLSERLTAS